MPSTREKIMIAASQLDPTFSLSDLMVRAWQLYPDEFGMREYPYPDTNRLVPRIYGAEGLIKRGRLRWVGDQLEITPEGWNLIRSPRKSEPFTLDEAAARAIQAARGYR